MTPVSRPRRRRHRRRHRRDVWESRSDGRRFLRCPSSASALRSKRKRRQRRNHGCPRRHQRLRPHRSRRLPRRDRVGRRHRVGRHQRRRRPGDARSAAQVRHRLRALRRHRRSHRRGDRRQRRPDRDADGDRPRRASVGRARCRRRDRVERTLPRPPGRREAPAGRSNEGDRLCAREGAGRHGCARRQLRELRPGRAPHRLQRLVHDELPRTGREAAARRGWDPARH